MTDDEVGCSCIVDCAGLHEIAKQSENIKHVLLGQLEEGIIGVPVCVWREFKAIYEDEATELEQHVALKIKTKKEYHLGAASMADRLNSGFPRGAYDENSDLYTAAIASLEGRRVLTSSSQVQMYKNMDCECIDLDTWIEI